jgi:DNA replication and repair protein RecF
MHLKHLSAINFKSFRQVELELNPKINCFIGNNGQGKTNLLDAIYYLSMCKSAFNSSDRQVLRHGEQFFVIEGSYQRVSSNEDIYCGFKLDEGKIFRRNGKPTTGWPIILALFQLFWSPPPIRRLLTSQVRSDVSI